MGDGCRGEKTLFGQFPVGEIFCLCDEELMKKKEGVETLIARPWQKEGWE